VLHEILIGVNRGPVHPAGLRHLARTARSTGPGLGRTPSTLWRPRV